MINGNTAKDIFANKLRELREEKGLSQNDLAKELGVSRGSISFYENSDRMAGIDFIYKASEYFNCTTDYLLGISDYKNQVDIERALTALKVFNDEFHNLSPFQKDQVINIAEFVIYFCENFKEHDDIIKSYCEAISLVEACLMISTINYTDISKQLTNSSNGTKIGQSVSALIFSTLKMNENIIDCTSDYQDTIIRKMREIMPEILDKVDDEQKRQLTELFASRDSKQFIGKIEEVMPHTLKNFETDQAKQIKNIQNMEFTEEELAFITKNFPIM